MNRVGKELLTWVLERPWLVIAVVGLTFALGSKQGLEMTDEGFWGCFYQQIFDVPHSAQVFEFLYWFTGVVGGVWNWLWPSGGLLWFRLFGVLVLCGTMLMSASILKPYVDRRVVILSLLLCALLQNNVPNIFYEKNWCGFLAVSMAFCLQRGLVRRKEGWLFAGGVVGIVMAFSRIPSVVMLALGGSILFYGYIRAISVRECAVFLGWFVLGSVVGLGVMFGCMAMFGHVGDFVGTLRFMVDLAADSSGDIVNAHHGWKSLLIVQQGFLLSIAVIGLMISGLLVVTSGGVLFVRNSLSHPVMKSVGVYVCQAVLVLGVLFLARRQWDSIAFLACFSGVIGVLGISRLADPDSGRRLLNVIALGILILLPLGSDVPLSFMRYALWLAVPLSLDCLLRLFHDVRVRVLTEACGSSGMRSGSFDTVRFFPEIGRMLVICFVIITLLNAWFWWGGINRDGGGRLNMCAQTQSPSVYGILTSRERSAALNEMLSELGRHVRKGDKLLVFANMPMLHMLTKTRPYLGFSWVKLLTVEQFRSTLDYTASKNPTLPVVVAHKRNVGEDTWPSKATSYLTAPYVVGRYAVLTEFLQTNDYKCVWENGDFLVWCPARR